MSAGALSGSARVSVSHRRGESVATNGVVEIAVAQSFGPRVTSYAFVGEPNVLGVLDPEEAFKDTPLGRWHLRGGHRLWYAPEDAVASYAPDDAPVALLAEGASISVTQNVEAHSGLEKSIRLALDADGTSVTLTHRIRSTAREPIQLAPWALTVMRAGGTAILPNPPFVPWPEALAPSRPLVMWPFTRMSDPRWSWGDRYVRLRHDAACATQQKIGAYDREGFLAYATGDVLFVKEHTPSAALHADLGCNVEIFTDAKILELETLGPLVMLAPGAAITHVERWSLFRAPGIGRVAREADDETLTRAIAACGLQSRSLR